MSLEDKCALKRTTLSAIERTRDNPFFIIINTCFSFVNPTLGGAVERKKKNTTFVVPRSLQTLFDCKFCFFVNSIDVMMSFVIMRG
jgi:hypothetical protein